MEKWPKGSKFTGEYKEGNNNGIGIINFEGKASKKWGDFRFWKSFFFEKIENIKENGSITKCMDMDILNGKKHCLKHNLEKIKKKDFECIVREKKYMWECGKIM